MTAAYTIGQLAEAAEVPTSTVRYYERRGLLVAESRAKGDYRQYDEAALSRLRFIRAAQDSGFTLKDITHLLTLVEQKDGRCDEVQAVLFKRLQEVRRKLESLRQVESGLTQMLGDCRGAEGAGPCGGLAEMERLEKK